MEAHNKLDEWFAREELMWKQMARADWLKRGDKNMAFFKAKATQRKERKIIKSIKKADDTMVYDTTNITVEFTNFFKALFQDPQMNTPKIGMKLSM